MALERRNQRIIKMETLVLGDVDIKIMEDLFKETITNGNGSYQMQYKQCAPVEPGFSQIFFSISL